jgi:hypothetical protein
LGETGKGVSSIKKRIETPLIAKEKDLKQVFLPRGFRDKTI